MFAVALLCGCFQPDNGFSSGARFRNGGRYFGLRPVLSPDGKCIVFSAATKSTPGGLFKVFVDKGVTSPISTTSYYQGQADVSPDGQTIVFVSEQFGLPAIWLCNIDGTNSRRVTQSDYAETSPVFSADGNKIAFVRRLTKNPEDRTRDELFVVNSDGTSERRVTNDNFTDYPVRFSGDGKSLYSVSSKIIRNGVSSASNRMNLFKTTIDDMACSLTLALRLQGPECDISMDEQNVVFVDDTNTPHQSDIYSCKIDGSQKKRLTNLNGYIGSVRFGFHVSDFVFVEEPKRDGFGTIYLFDLLMSTEKKVDVISAP